MTGSPFEVADARSEKTDETAIAKISVRGNRERPRAENSERDSQTDRPNSTANASQRPRKGPDPDDPNRKPWIEAHAAEIDADKDGSVSRPELIAEITKTLQTLDTNSDKSISKEESQARGNRLPMAGFVKGHFDELDKNSDTKISSKELSDSFLRMYDRQGQKKRK